MPISSERKQEKINFLFRKSIEFIDKNDKRISSLTDPLTFDEIGTLFDEYAITFVNIKEDVENPIFTNSSKFITKHKIIYDNMYMIVHQKDNNGKIIEITLINVIKQLFPNASNEEINYRINECFTLNQTVFQNFDLKKAYKLNLKTNTILYLPDNWNVPELNIPSDLILKKTQIYKGKFINLEDESKSFFEKCDSNEKFPEKLPCLDDDLSNSFEKITFNHDDDDDDNNEYDDDYDNEEVLKAQRLTSDPLPILDEQNHPIWQNDVQDVSSSSSEYKFCGFCRQILQKDFLFCINSKCGKKQ